MTSVIDVVSNVTKKPVSELTIESSLIGEEGLLDSLGLVELCLQLEDLAATLNFEFDWTSDASMSRNKSMFRSIAALQEEFDRQRAL